MLTFYATFARYNSKTTESQLSGEMQIQASSFSEAHAKAELVIAAWRDVLPEWDTKLTGLRTHDYQGIKFKGYLSVWEDPPSQREPVKMAT